MAVLRLRSRGNLLLAQVSATSNSRTFPCAGSYASILQQAADGEPVGGMQRFTPQNAALRKHGLNRTSNTARSEGRVPHRGIRWLRATAYREGERNTDA